MYLCRSGFNRAELGDLAARVSGLALAVRPAGNLTIGPQQFWLRPSRAGQTVTAWIDTTSCHLSIGGWRVKTVPSRLSAADLARLRRNGARPAGAPPSAGSPGPLAASTCVEVERVVSASGAITLGNQVVLVGSPLAGQRARIRLDGQLMHVITQDGTLWRSQPCPIRPASGTGCKAPGWPGQPRCPPRASRCSARYPAAAASWSPPRKSRSA